MKPVADSCARVDELLLDYAYGELDGARAREVEDHLSACPACRAALAKVADTRRAMAVLTPELAPSAGLDSLLAYAEQAASRARTSPPPRGRWRWLSPALSAGLFASVILVVSRHHGSLTLSRASAPSAAQGGSSPAILAPATAASPSSPMPGPFALAKAFANKEEVAPLDLAPPDLAEASGNASFQREAVAPSAQRPASPRKQALDARDGSKEASRGHVGGDKLEMGKMAWAEKKKGEKQQLEADGAPRGRVGGAGAGLLGAARVSEALAGGERPRDAEATAIGRRSEDERAHASDKAERPFRQKAARAAPAVAEKSTETLEARADSDGANERRDQVFESDRPASTGGRAKDGHVAPGPSAPAEPESVAQAPRPAPAQTSAPPPPGVEPRLSATAPLEYGSARAPSPLSADRATPHDESRRFAELLSEAHAAAGRGEHASAVALLRSALAFVRGTADEPTALLLLAQEQAAAGQPQAAVDALAQVLERHPSDARAPQALLTRIRLLEGLQRLGEARADREALRRSYPRSNQARSLADSNEPGLPAGAASAPQTEKAASKTR